MRHKHLKFIVGIGIILVVVGWEAISGFRQSKTYYLTVNELIRSHEARGRVRVGGTVVPGSIQRRGGTLTFRLGQNGQSVPVTYVGTETLPDTFVDGAQAIIEGSYAPSGTFKAEKIQAKCASKYQAATPSSEQASDKPISQAMDSTRGK